MANILKHSVELLVNPFFICLLALFGVSLSHYFYKTYARFIIIGVTFCLLLISTGWLPSLLTSTLEARYAPVVAPNTQVKWVVVLGGGSYPVKELPVNDLLTSSSIKRLIEGIRLINLLPNARLLLSGGNGGRPPRLAESEASLMARLATSLNVAPVRMVLEKTSLNTADEARELFKVLGKEPFYLVTSAIHMPRSMALCLKQGLQPIAAPTDFTLFWKEQREKRFIPNGYNIQYFNIAFHELLGLLWAKWIRAV